MPNQHSTPEEEARLLYVAMTRAIEQLILTSVGAARLLYETLRERHRSSEFTSRLERVLEKVTTKIKSS
ncbi:hypothetical protein [Nostoc sp.]|uniref:hypothetical protein n=1 Tax=Nostoc sp. TaxID=1180 RepID=UPI002FF85D50